MSALSRITGAARNLVATTKAFGQYATGTGFQIPLWFPTGWWQAGYRVPERGPNATVEACVAAISQTVASMPLQLWRKMPNGGHEEITTGPIVEVLRKPNPYQTRADFVLNLVRTEQLSGNGVAVAARDGGVIRALYPLMANTATPYVTRDGEVFYSVASQTDLLPDPPVESFWPASDVLHIRMQTPTHPLIGESPILAAAMATASGNAIQAQLAAFFSNMARPSGYLTSPKILAPELAAKLREEWEKAYSVENTGRIAVLLDGLDWKPMSVTSVDAQLIESYRMTIADIARVYRTPLAVIGDNGGTIGNTETLIRHWLATGLGYIIEHIELSLDRLFGLPPDQYTAFDVESLLRTDFLARIDGLTKGIVGGLFSPNEARAREGLARVEYGDEPRLQAQVVPLSFATLNPALAAASSTPAAPAAGKEAPLLLPPPRDMSEDEEVARFDAMLLDIHRTRMASNA